jgi:hypothetical protein
MPRHGEAIDLTVFGLIGRGNAGVPNDINGLAIHEATIFCHPPFVTNKMKARCRFVNSGERYTLWRVRAFSSGTLGHSY